jgi:hypothetical protein
MCKDQIDQILLISNCFAINREGVAGRASTIRRTPALINMLAAIERFLLVTFVVQAILNAIVTTREKQNPITMA